MTVFIHHPLFLPLAEESPTGAPHILVTGGDEGAVARVADALRAHGIDVQLGAPADGRPGAAATPSADPPSLDRIEWDHIQHVLAATGGNISAAARLLGIARRSLQRKLSKFPPAR